MMLWRDQAEHVAMSLSMAAGWLVLETNSALTVEQRDRTDGDPAVPAPHRGRARARNGKGGAG
jgi:hypothetical protein